MEFSTWLGGPKTFNRKPSHECKTRVTKSKKFVWFCTCGEKNDKEYSSRSEAVAAYGKNHRKK